MRKGFRSSRGAIRGRTGWGTAFATVAMDMSLLELRGYALAARRKDCEYRARHSAEQKCKTWPACSRGNEISGEMCVPHNGSRCSAIAFRAAPRRELDMGATSRNTMDMSLRKNHPSP